GHRQRRTRTEWGVKREPPDERAVVLADRELDGYALGEGSRDVESAVQAPAGTIGGRTVPECGRNQVDNVRALATGPREAQDDAAGGDQELVRNRQGAVCRAEPVQRSGADDVASVVGELDLHQVDLHQTSGWSLDLDPPRVRGARFVHHPHESVLVVAAQLAGQAHDADLST